MTAYLGRTCCSHVCPWIELLHTLSKDNGVVILCWDFSTPRIEICFPTLPIVEAFSTAIDDRYFTNGVAFIAYIPVNSGVKSRRFGVFNQICAAGLPKYCFPIVQPPPTLRNVRPSLIAVYVLRHLDVGQSLDLLGSGQPLTISAEGKSYVLLPLKVPRWRARFQKIC